MAKGVVQLIVRSPTAGRFPGMLLRRFYDENLAQASYLIGCQATGEALVVDPNRMVDDYLAAAAAEGLKIAHVTETHIHADFVSGTRELATRTGAQLYLSGEGKPDWEYRFARVAKAVVLHDGDSFDVGNIRIDVMHTPGHTPEHLAFLVTDGAATTRPMGMISGDFIFAGDVGRPDLLERVANDHGTMHAMARVLFQSLQRTRDLPDYLQLWPGHGAGSACGKALGAIPSTTLGYERLVNWAFQVHDEETFVGAVLAGQPDAPRYFARMKQINRDGPPPLPALDWAATSLGLPEVESRMARGAWVVDARPANAFAAGHIPGTINIPMNASFATWMGSLVPYDRELLLVLPGDERARAPAVRALCMIGLDSFAGFADDAVLRDWTTSGRALATTPQIDAAALAARRDVQVLDVRNNTEWGEGHIPGAIHVALADLAEHVADLPIVRPIVVHCKSGTRSAIATSLLETHGVLDVINLRGGFDAWKSAGLSITID
jgi:hydroxyacylglutathione hydrolase